MSFSSAVGSSVLFISLLLTLTLLLTYTVTSVQAYVTIHSRKVGKIPPVTPYWILGLGHAPSFLWDTSNVARLSKSIAHSYRPVRLKLGHEDLTLVTGSDNIIQLWRSKMLDAKAVTCFSLRTFFNTPKRAMKMYHDDNSGISLQPHPNSKVSSKDRYYFHHRRETVGFFNGPTLKQITGRFQKLLIKHSEHIQIGKQWSEMPDLYTYVQEMLFGPAVEAMCRPMLMSQNPNFGADFWKLDSDLLYFFKGFPCWLAPSAWKTRDRALADIKTWHAFARANFDESCIETDGHDQFWGSPLIRRRQDYLSQIDSIDADALASQDLGLIWAENTNSIPAVFWLLVELLQRPHVYARIQEEIATSHSTSSSHGAPELDVESLCSKPFLQSAYAETLRLYISLFALRSPAHEDFKLGSWRIPKDKLIGVDSRVAAMDASFWNTSGNSIGDKEFGSRPLTHFWPERFLEYPGDPYSGPLRCNAHKSSAKAGDRLTDPKDASKPRFTMEGLAGAWLPFGDGMRQCPGKNFAKQEIIVSFAVIITMFEIELVDSGNIVKPDMKYYGLGTLPPKGRTPFRIRKRYQSQAGGAGL